MKNFFKAIPKKIKVPGESFPFPVKDFLISLTLYFSLSGLFFFGASFEGENPLGQKKFSLVITPDPKTEKVGSFLKSILENEWSDLKQICQEIGGSESLGSGTWNNPLEIQRGFALQKEVYHLDFLDLFSQKNSEWSQFEKIPRKSLEKRDEKGLSLEEKGSIQNLGPSGGSWFTYYFTYVLPLEEGGKVLIAGRKLEKEWLKKNLREVEILFVFNSQTHFFISSGEGFQQESLFYLARKSLETGENILHFQGQHYYIVQNSPPEFPENLQILTLTKVENFSVAPLVQSGLTQAQILFLSCLLFTLFSWAHYYLRAQSEWINQKKWGELFFNQGFRFSKEQLKGDLSQVREVLEGLKIHSGEKGKLKWRTEQLDSFGQFSMGIAHEINNPLGIIVTTGEFLLNHTDLGSDQKEEVQEIIKQGLRCKKILSQLLHFSKNQPISPKPTSLTLLIEEMKKTFKHLAEGKEIDFVFLDKGVPLVETDPDILGQILLNLYKNAVESIPFRGEVSTVLSIEEEKGEITLDIRDNGKGIEKGDQDKIFNPFFTKKEKGTGLGLPICFHLAHQLGGQLNFESQVGEGSLFTLQLPVNPPHPLPAQSSSDPDQLKKVEKS